MNQTPTTVNTRAFLGLITDALATAGQDAYPPALSAVFLHSAGGNLVATSTDRYVIGQAHMPMTGPDLGPVLVARSDWRRVLPMLRPYQGTQRRVHARIGEQYRAVAVNLRGDIPAVPVFEVPQSAGVHTDG